MKLYDLTTLCEEAEKENYQNPFTLPVAVLLYKWVCVCVVWIGVSWYLVSGILEFLMIVKIILTLKKIQVTFFDLVT